MFTSGVRNLCETRFRRVKLGFAAEMSFAGYRARNTLLQVRLAKRQYETLRNPKLVLGFGAGFGCLVSVNKAVRDALFWMSREQGLDVVREPHLPVHVPLPEGRTA